MLIARVFSDDCSTLERGVRYSLARISQCQPPSLRAVPVQLCYCSSPAVDHLSVFRLWDKPSYCTSLLWTARPDCHQHCLELRLVDSSRQIDEHNLQVIADA